MRFYTGYPVKIKSAWNKDPNKVNKVMDGIVEVASEILKNVTTLSSSCL